MNEKKKKQLFTLLVLCMIVFGLLCATGCSGNACKGIEYSKEEVEGASVTNISVLGCAGLTECAGCNNGLLCSRNTGCAACAMHHDCTLGCWDEYAPTNNGQVYDGTLVACDNIYYGANCNDCGEKKSDYCGFIDYSDEKNEFIGVFMGATNDYEILFGCGNGCIGCIETEGTVDYMLHGIEYWD